MNRKIIDLVYVFSGIMLVASVITADEPLALFTAIGMGMLFGGDRYVPGIPGKAISTVGLAVALIASFLALVIIVGLIAILVLGATGSLAIGAVPWL